MKLKGITIDFDDKKTCGLLPDLCFEWDEKFEELEDNQKLIKYWENNVNKVLSQTKNIITGTINSRAIICSANDEAIKIIKETFKDLELSTISYEELMQCESCLSHNYLDNDFNKEK
ncbi:hypothetical protein CRV00_02355 [Malaciobacter molluscorum]|uniref:hypothetical protein n=1 Tax=Malaciobacter molluscorum TaxID=1032072 RepID=UPI00100B0B99|nr:hypothetical protein [Malaciobacter molluscorum]RXJ96477.1 hypothetical protein CRV00_02355 [Malaciobacter molluscorum]